MSIWTSLEDPQTRYVWCDNIDHPGDAHLEVHTCINPADPRTPVEAKS